MQNMYKGDANLEEAKEIEKIGGNRNRRGKCWQWWCATCGCACKFIGETQIPCIR